MRLMRAYASRTGTRRNLAALREHGWRLMVSATGVWRDEGFRYAIDNGAWTAYQQDRPFDSTAFRGLVEKMGKGADFVVIPDIVAAGPDSLDFSLTWIPYLESKLPGVRLLLAVQDGMTPRHVEHVVCSRIGVFAGGTTDWKLNTMPMWGELCRSRGAYFHVGRVNTRRRIRHCYECDAHSFDGTSVTRFASTIHKLDAERHSVPFYYNPAGL